MMPPSILLSPMLWAEATFSSVRLGNPRSDRRTVAIAHALAREPGASLPEQLHDKATSEATYPGDALQVDEQEGRNKRVRVASEGDRHKKER